jgi:radical SAM protein with 4Fe4S-binding SPASM domain
MTPQAFLSMSRDFLSIRPTVRQVINATKYSYCYFTDNFKTTAPYDPLSIGLYLTYRCNLTCAFCWNPVINEKPFISDDLNVEDVRKILSHPRLKNAFRVSFVGGEPLVHDEIFEFIEIARKNKKLTMFPSNGLHIEKRLDEFKKSSLTTIQVSLYDGLVEKQMENVKKLRVANPKINVSVARYVTKEFKMLEYMHEVIKMAADANVKQICFQNFQPKDRTDAHLAIYDDDHEVLEYIDEVRKKHGKRFNIMFPAPLKRNPQDRFCYDLYTVVFVGKRGDVVPCSSIVPPSKKFGNIFDDDFWNNEYTKDHRENYNSKFPYDPVCEFCYESSKHERHFI